VGLGAEVGGVGGRVGWATGPPLRFVPDEGDGGAVGSSLARSPNRPRIEAAGAARRKCGGAADTDRLAEIDRMGTRYG